MRLQLVRKNKTKGVVGLVLEGKHLNDVHERSGSCGIRWSGFPGKHGNVP